MTEQQVVRDARLDAQAGVADRRATNVDVALIEWAKAEEHVL